MLGLYLLLALIVTAFLGWRLIKRVYPWVVYDIKFYWILILTLRKLAKFEKRIPNYTLVDELIDKAKKIPQKIYIFYENETWTYKKFNDMSNRVAKVMRKAGVKKDRTVSVMMFSTPEMLAVIFGVAKAGGASALINYNNRKKNLLHLLQVAGSDIVVIQNEPELVQAIHEIRKYLNEEGITVYVLGDVKGVVNLEYKPLHLLMGMETKQEVTLEWRRDVTLKSDFSYIFTSGTTGLPKAALMRQDKAWMVGRLLTFADVNENDVIYTPLPLYHSSALIGALGALCIGCSVVLKRKFSASHFWEDCRRFRATVVQYVGETMRYVCNQPPSEDDRKHCVRLAVGNGMRSDVWRKFLDRNGNHIRVVEFYGASEGNRGFINLNGQIGSIGMLSPLTRVVGGVRLVKYDHETNEPIRDDNGRCIDVPPNTAGLMIAKVSKISEFHGYRGDQKQTEEKLLKNVTKDGDSFFNSGDLMKCDKDHNLYFVDRIGDNFRWKGENVSTNEVADVMSDAPSIREASVYGVRIEGTEGKAGMMVTILQEGVDFDGGGVYQHATECLAPYARPIFIRVKQEMKLTSTFKYIKTQLAKEGFSLENVGDDRIYFMDKGSKRYVPLTAQITEDLLEGKIKL